MTTSGKPASSVRVEQDKRPAWLPWLIGLLLLALLALVLFFVFNDDDDAAADGLATDEAISQDAEVEDEPDVTPPTDEPILDIDGEVDGETTLPGENASPFVLALPFTELADHAGEPVTAGGIEVVDVPADEAFTIGNADDELLVVITPQARSAGGPESATNVKPGSTVTSLEGTLEPIDDQLISSLQLEGDEADAVKQKGFYVAATSFELAAA